MTKKFDIIQFITLPLILFLFSLFLRRHFFCGFILGDDIQEFGLVSHILENGVNLNDQLALRFGVWLFNLIAFKLLGISESSFFLPTWLMSASLSVIGYYILISKKYDVYHAFFAGLIIASAPFEVLIGTVRANDLILSWLLAVGFFFFVLFEEKPFLQGMTTAFFLWFGFYVKLWVVYFLPSLGIYYLIQIVKEKKWQNTASFTAVSLMLHTNTCLLWKMKTGYFLPFIHNHAATYPVQTKDLPHLFSVYPEMIFSGSEFGTTLFGSIPYLLLLCLVVKGIRGQGGSRGFDKLDYFLTAYYGTFFLFLNFFPNAFVFDQYYSAPRIFRYLTPISFPTALHLAKLIIDFSDLKLGRLTIGKHETIIILTGIVCINLFQANIATKPGQIYYENLQAVIRDIKKEHPPALLTEAWISYFIRQLYLKDEAIKTDITPIYDTYNVSQYESWLQKNQSRFQKDTLLLTGLCSYIHYGAHFDGFRLTKFQNPLHPSWDLFKEYGMLTYLPKPEYVRLWRLSQQISPQDIADIETETSALLFKKATDLFDKHNYADAQKYFKKILTEFEKYPQTDDAFYFYAICFFRNADWRNTIAEFTKLIKTNPQSRWLAGAYYHIGLCRTALGQKDEARNMFKYVVAHFPDDTILVELSEKQLADN